MENRRANFLDKLIRGISPQWAFKRAQHNIAIEYLHEQKRIFDAATKSRRTSDWHAAGASSNTENRGALATLRNRARDLTRNNPYAKKAMDVIGTNTVGGGIIPTPITASQLENDRVKKAWKEWADSTDCDYDGRLNFYGIQKLVMRAVAESGEVLVRRRRVSPKICPLGIQLQVLEADFLDLNKTISEIESGGYIIQGVEFDKDGRRIAYWLYQIHPGESSLTQPIRAYVSVRIPADEVIHVFNRERPGQERGVPFGTSAMMRLYDFDQYEDAQLIRQKIAACFAVFVQDAQADSLPGGQQNDGTLSEKVEPGIIEHLPSGKTVTFGNPPATTNYAEYSRKILQGSAAGYGTTYESLTGDLSNVNFSSGRMGWLEFHKLVTDWQNNILIPSLCNGVWKWFIGNAYIAGFVKKENTKATWTAPRREMIDPVKETTGITNQVRAGLRTWSEAVREQGFDPEDVIEEYAKELALFDKHKIIFDTDMRFQVKQTVQEPNVGAKTGA